jgi:dihydrodipicolinate synthase/N-acetylneuraminate lyase
MDGAFIPAVPLALDNERHFDVLSQHRLIRYYLNCGADGIAAAVHSTQFEIRNPEHNLLRPVLKEVSDEITGYERETGRTIIKIAGVCGKTEQAVNEARKAAWYGYDAVLLSPGGLGDLNENEMISRTEEVAAILPVIGFYLQTAVGGRKFSYDYWRRMCEIPNVMAIKCASFDRYSTIDVVRAAAFSSREIALYTGNDDHIIMDLLTPYKFGEKEKRFTGGLLGHWAVWTKKAVEIFREVKNQNATPEFMTTAAEITDMNAAVFDAANGFRGCIAGINEVLRRQGLFDSILCLNPDEKLSDGQSEEIDRVCKMYPHLI